MGKDIKKLLDKISGKEVNHVKVTGTEPWGGDKYRLGFDVEIDRANLGEFEGHNYILMYLMVKNRTINGEVDEEEFEWQFQKPLFQESLKERIHEKYKIEMFGVDFDFFEIEYKFL